MLIFWLFFSVSARTSPKAQRPSQSRTVRATNSLTQSTGTFSHLIQSQFLYYQWQLSNTFFLSYLLSYSVPQISHFTGHTLFRHIICVPANSKDIWACPALPSWWYSLTSPLFLVACYNISWALNVVEEKNPTFVFLVNEILCAAAKERSAESPSSTEDSKNSKGGWTRFLNG